MNRQDLSEGLSALLAGLLLYGAAAGVETLFAAGPLASAGLEELGKLALLLGFGWTRTRGEAGKPRPNRVRLARGLSLGLVAIAIFAATENLAYLAAFREAGVLARLGWSLPVHLVAGLAEALGVLFLFRNVEGKRTLRRTLVGISLGFASLCLAGAWHVGANMLVSERLDPMVFTAGVVSANLLFLLLLSQFLKQAYLGGFLHGAD